MTWKCFPHYRFFPFMRTVLLTQVDTPHKGVLWSCGVFFFPHKLSKSSSVPCDLRCAMTPMTPTAIDLNMSSFGCCVIFSRVISHKPVLSDSCVSRHVRCCINILCTADLCHITWIKQVWYTFIYIYRQTSNIRCTLVGNKIVDHSNVVGASPVSAAPTTSSFST